MALDSDELNADAHLHVEFYEHKREPHIGKPFVRIMVPGDKNNIVDRPVREDDKRRFPRQWLYFQMQNAGDQVPGAPLSKWHEDEPEVLTEGFMEELAVLKFQVVEQVATASDAQLQRVGMGGVGIRERAKAYLTRRNASAGSREMDELKAELAQMRALLSQPQPQIEPPKNKGGRPRKDLNVNNDHAATHAAGDS